MRRKGLVLAAHGSRSDPSACAIIHEHVARVARLGLFDEVRAAFHDGEPTFSRVLDELTVDDVTVVPMMTSVGYYCDEVLPRELARNRSFPRIRVRRTQPVGDHPAMVPLAAGRIRARLREHVLDPGLTTVAIIGHGTQRHAQSRTATLKLVEALRKLDVVAEVIPAFLEDHPSIASTLGRAEQPGVVVLPLLMGGGIHAIRDVPTRLGLQPFSEGQSTQAGWVGHQFVVCDAALGADSRISDIVVRLAKPPRKRTSAALLPEDRPLSPRGDRTRLTPVGEDPGSVDICQTRKRPKRKEAL